MKKVPRIAIPTFLLALAIWLANHFIDLPDFTAQETAVVVGISLVLVLLCREAWNRLSRRSRRAAPSE